MGWVTRVWVDAEGGGEDQMFRGACDQDSVCTRNVEVIVVVVVELLISNNNCCCAGSRFSVLATMLIS